MSWGFRSLVTTKNDLKCATHFQGLCVSVFIWVRVIRIPNVFFGYAGRGFHHVSSLFACLFVDSQVKWVKNAGWDSTGVMAMNGVIPSGYVKIAMETHHFSCENPL